MDRCYIQSESESAEGRFQNPQSPARQQSATHSAEDCKEGTQQRSLENQIVVARDCSTYGGQTARKNRGDYRWAATTAEVI
jgi:hypothetical protein